MPILVSSTTVSQSTGATLVATLPAGIQANDLIIIAMQTGNATGNSAESGTSEYTEFGTIVSNDSQRLALFRKTASGSDVARSFTVPGGAVASAIISVYRGVDVSADPIRAIAKTDYTTYAWENNTGTISANVDDLLVLANVGDGAAILRYAPDKIRFLNRIVPPGGNGSLIMGYRSLGATETTSADKVYTTSTAEGGTGYVFALKHLTNAAKQPRVETGISVLNYHGAFADASSTSQQKWSTSAGNALAPNTVLSGATIGGVGFSTIASAVATAATTAFPFSSIFGTGTALTHTESTAGLWVGAGWLLPSWPVDLTSKIYRVQFSVNNSTSRRGSQGFAVLFSDTTGKWAAYTLMTKEALSFGTERVVEIALGNATLLASSETPSTIDWTNIKHRLFLEHRIGSSASADILNVKDELLLSTAIITGGSSVAPGNWVKIAEALIDWDFYKLAGIQGGVQTEFKQSIQIGDASRATYWDSNGGSFAFPTAYSTLTGVSQQEWNVNTGIVGIIPNPASGDTILMSNGAAYTATQQNLLMQGNSGATVEFQQAFVGFAPTLLSGETYTSTTWSGGDTVQATGANLVGCTISAPNSNVSATEAALSYTVNGKTLDASTVDLTGSSVGYHVALSSGITAFTVQNNTQFLGTPAVTIFYSELAAGELIITSDGTGTALVAGDVTFIGGSTAFVTIAAPTVNQSVALTGLSTTCRVQLYDTDALDELYNAEPGATSLTWDDPIAATADRPIRLRITDYLGTTAKVMVERNIGTCGTTSGTAAISFNNEFEEDTNYNAQASALGITGADVTDIEIVDATNHVNFNFLAGGDYDARRIYLYMVYWLDTEAGIRDDFVFCSPLDPVNLPMQGVLFENVTSPQEIITFVNAYVYDADTGRAKDLIVGDGINFAPDHVVQVIASVGGVNIITGDIADVAAEVQTGLTAQGLTTTRAAKIDNLDQPISRTLVTQIATRR